jgi:hypothetical protein
MDFSKDYIEGAREYLHTDAKCLKLDLEIPHEAMASEAQALKDRFIRYRKDDGYDHHDWFSLPLYGLGLDRPMSWDAYGYLSPREAAKDFSWTEIAEQCPVTVDWLKNIFPSQRLGRVRFMLLKAGGFISRHRDSPYSIPDAVNIALTNHPNCIWWWADGDRIDFKPGDAYAMNLSYEHSIENRSIEDRYHLIVHHHDSTPEWKNMMIQAMERQNATGDFYYSTDLY